MWTLLQMCMREIKGCDGDGWEIELSEARESETIIKVLVIDEGGRASIC